MQQESAYRLSACMETRGKQAGPCFLGCTVNAGGELPGWDLPNAKGREQGSDNYLFREKNTDTTMQALAGMYNLRLIFFQTRVAKISCCGLCDSIQNYNLFDRMFSLYSSVPSAV